MPPRAHHRIKPLIIRLDDSQIGGFSGPQQITHTTIVTRGVNIDFLYRRCIMAYARRDCVKAKNQSGLHGGCLFTVLIYVSFCRYEPGIFWLHLHFSFLVSSMAHAWLMFFCLQIWARGRCLHGVIRFSAAFVCRAG